MKVFKYTKNIKHKGINFNFRKINYGKWAIQAADYGILSSKHLTSLRQELQKNFKKVKKFRFNLTMNKIKTKKPLDTRMGGGKGLLYDKQYFLKPGSIFLEFIDVASSLSLAIFKLIINKISIKFQIMGKRLGFVLNSNRYYTLLVIPYRFFHHKYKKMQVKIKRYYIINYRKEYVIGDILLLSPKDYNVYIL